MAKKLRPIPRRLLVHDVTVKVFESDTPFGRKESPPEEMKRVRIEPAFKIRRNFDGVDVDINSVMFIDQINTINPIALPVRSTVYWQGVEMKVVDCKIFYDFDGQTPHHYEVLLV